MIENGEIVLYDLNMACKGLASHFEVNLNSCGNHEHYESYIRYTAISDRNCGLGVTYVFLQSTEDSEKILGYITLRAASYVTESEGVTYGHPALEIFELAVDKTAERQCIGTNLVNFALKTANDLRKTFLGIEYIILCADKQAVPFYEKVGFGRMDEQGKIPREQWNVNCIPMLLRLPEDMD